VAVPKGKCAHIRVDGGGDAFGGGVGGEASFRCGAEQFCRAKEEVGAGLPCSASSRVTITAKR
jgi:hypothetical protein